MNTEYITQFERQLGIKRYAASTIRTYISQIIFFLSYFDDQDAKSISVRDIELYIQKLVNEDKISFST